MIFCVVGHTIFHWFDIIGDCIGMVKDRWPSQQDKRLHHVFVRRHDVPSASVSWKQLSKCEIHLTGPSNVYSYETQESLRFQNLILLIVILHIRWHLTLQRDYAVFWVQKETENKSIKFSSFGVFLKAHDEKFGTVSLYLCLEQLPFIGASLGFSLDVVACVSWCGHGILLVPSICPRYVNILPNSLLLYPSICFKGVCWM